MSATVTVTTWYLEQTSPADLVPAREPESARGAADAADGGAAGDGVRIVRAGVPSPEFSRFLYASVGADITWTDRLPWTYARWTAYLERPLVETWVAYENGTPAGFIELNGADSAQGDTEIAYFGLLPAFRGRRIGGHLLSYGVARAWDIAERWEGAAPAKRVWVHTCSKDGEHALANYRRRGFRVYRTETEQEPIVPTPGPWPGA